MLNDLYKFFSVVMTLVGLYLVVKNFGAVTSIIAALGNQGNALVTNLQGR